MEPHLKPWFSLWEGEVPWQKQEVNPYLAKFIESTKTCGGKSLRVLVPGCGKTVDMKWLVENGCTVVGVEVVRRGILEFFQDHNIEYKQDKITLNENEVYVYSAYNDQLKIFEGDFLKFDKEHFDGAFDICWDRGLIGSTGQDNRNKFVQKTRVLLKPKGKLFIEFFEYNAAERPADVPPFPFTEKEVRHLFSFAKVEKAGESVETSELGMKFLGLSKNPKLNYFIITTTE